MSQLPEAEVLIVEDEKKLRFFATEVMRLEQIRAAAVGDGCQAMAYLEDAVSRHAKLPSVILLDLTMPCMSGHEVYKRIAAAPYAREMTVIITSAAGDKIDTLPGPAATLQLTKPYEVTDLIGILHNAAPWLFAANG